MKVSLNMYPYIYLLMDILVTDVLDASGLYFEKVEKNILEVALKWTYIT